MRKGKVVCFLQNQWFKDPSRMAAIYARHVNNIDRRCDLDAAYLFMGCLTGRRIERAFEGFGDDARHSFIYANASPKFGGTSSCKFPADIKHMIKITDHFNPSIVVAFGIIARAGVRELQKHFEFEAVFAPHPAARGMSVLKDLDAAATEIRMHL